MPSLLRVAACLVVAAGTTFAADPLATLFGDPVVVRGTDVEVKRSQLDEAFIAFRANLAARGEDLKPSDRTAKEISLLERIILTQLLSKVSTEGDRTNAAALSKKFLDDARKMAGDTDEGFSRQLRSLGLTVDQFTRRVQEQSLVETVLDRVLKSSIVISEDAVKKFYADSPERFQQPELAKGQHIVMFTRDPRSGVDLTPDLIRPKKERLLRAQSRARAGEDFLTLIKEYSEDPEAVAKKGEFILSKINRLPEVEGAAFSLAINAVSDIIVTPNAMHILKVTERTPARQVELDKVRGDVEKFLSHREMEKKLPEFFAKLKADAKLEVLDSKYKSILDKVSADAFDPGLGSK